MSKRCKARNRDGSPCQAPGVTSSGFCFWHDPDRQADAQAARSRGGKTSSAGRATVEGEDLPLETAEDVKAALARIVNDCRGGRLDYRVSNACFVGLSAFLKALDQVDVEAGLASLREDIEAMKGTRATG